MWVSLEGPALLQAEDANKEASGPQGKESPKEIRASGPGEEEPEGIANPSPSRREPRL